MIAFTFLAALMLGAAQPAGQDGRVRLVHYDADEIVRIVGKPGIQSTISFSADERIENVAVGDSSKWQVTPNRRGSLLFVKPLAAMSRTNLTVVTDRRTYMFDLVAGEKGSAPVYSMRFIYPDEPQAPALAGPPIVTAAANQSQQSPGATLAKLHFDWKSKGFKKLIPGRVFDDGSSVYLAWPTDRPLPAIQTVSEDKREGPVNYKVEGGYIVIGPVPSNLVLRYGDRHAVLWRSAPVVQAAPPVVPAASDVPVRRTTVASVSPTIQRPPNPIIRAQSVASQHQHHASVPPAIPPARSAASAGGVRAVDAKSLLTDHVTGAHDEH